MKLSGMALVGSNYSLSRMIGKSYYSDVSYISNKLHIRKI